MVLAAIQVGCDLVSFHFLVGQRCLMRVPRSVPYLPWLALPIFSPPSVGFLFWITP